MILLFGLASIMIMAVIFWFSSRDGQASQSQSDKVLFTLPQWLHWLPYSTASFILRKGAHFSIYALLGFCLYFFFKPLLGIRASCLKTKHLSVLIPVFFAWLSAAAWSLLDEWHQTFVPGRSGELRDVLIDAAGALCGILTALLIQKLFDLLKSFIHSEPDC